MVGTQALEFGYESTNLLLYQYFTADKKSTCNAGDPVQSLGQEDPLEKGMATYSSILAWRIPWTEEPEGLLSRGSQRIGHN